MQENVCSLFLLSDRFFFSKVHRIFTKKLKKTIDRTKLACYITDRTKRGTEKDQRKDSRKFFKGSKASDSAGRQREAVNDNNPIK